MIYVLFDIGGTHTRVAITEDLETLAKVEVFKTPIKFEEGVKKIVAAVEKLTTETPVALAGGVRGLLNESKTGIHNDSILNAWAGKNIVEAIQKHFAVPMYLENDTALAGLGEATFGAGAGLDIVVYHSVSTGVGGVRVVNGALDEASIGFEPGHQVLDIDRTVLGDDIEPTLENLVSGSAVGERFGVKAQDIPQTDVVWDELAEYLAQGLRNSVLYWSPDAIVLGGAMITGQPAISVDSVRKYMVESLNGFVDSPFVTIAKLGDEAGLYGAMKLLQGK